MPVNAPPMNPEHLYRQITITDGKVGHISESIPVTLEEGRLVDNPIPKHLFEGSTFLNGQLFRFPIDAESLSDAIAKFHTSVIKAIEDLQDAQRRAQIANPAPLPGMVGRVVPPGRR